MDSSFGREIAKAQITVIIVLLIVAMVVGAVGWAFVSWVFSHLWWV